MELPLFLTFYGAGATDAMMTPLLATPSGIVVMLTFPAGETGEPLLANIPAPSNAVSVSIGVAPIPAARCRKDQSPCTTNDPVATVVRDVVIDVLPAPAVLVVDASGWPDCFTLYRDAACEMR
jgi:hypothetical protein